MGPSPPGVAARVAPLGSAKLADAGKATLDGFQRRVGAAFLLDQEKLNASGVFGCLENLLLGCDSFAEQHLVTLVGIGRPVLAVNTLTAGSISFGLDDPIRRAGRAWTEGRWIGSYRQSRPTL